MVAFCSFYSLVGEMCGPSPENLNVVGFLDLKNCDRDVKAHLKFCNILTNVESGNSKRKLGSFKASGHSPLYKIPVTKEC